MLNSVIISGKRYPSFIFAAKKTAVIFGQTLAFFLTLALCIPAFLLPSTTHIPLSLWLMLILTDLGLVAIFFKIKPFKKSIAISLTGVCIIALLAVFASRIYVNPIPVTTFHIGGNTILSTQQVEGIDFMSKNQE